MAVTRTSVGLPISFLPSTSAPGTSNVAADGLPFQRWYRFKEAFSPSFVASVMRSARCEVKSCLDPFSGSGTTALTAQLLGAHPSLIEVNPFLADLSEVKLVQYDVEQLLADRLWLDSAITEPIDHNTLDALLDRLPATFIEPGVGDRWIFDRAVARRIQGYLSAIDSVANVHSRRLFRVLLGSVLITLSNVTISGKGRRYRGSWRDRYVDPESVGELFNHAFLCAYEDICSFRHRRSFSYTLYRGDCRQHIHTVDPVDLVLFSPPYPNSFDYTDIYNVELWMLGYLQQPVHNRALREATLRSHVQIKRDFARDCLDSATLADTVAQLHERRDNLWDADLPAMVTSYFADMVDVLRQATDRLNPQGELVMVVGDSRYVGVTIPVAEVLQDVAPQAGLACIEVREVRSMRSSPQHGGVANLREWLVRCAPA